MNASKEHASGATGSGSGATVELRQVTKRYDPGTKGPDAVNDLSFTVPAGKVCVLVGPSGCGKTTTLKMVNRLIEPTSGQILIDGVDVMTQNATRLRRRIGYVIQQVGLFPHLTIGQNVAVVPRLLGWKPQRIRERVDELLTLVGLDAARYRDRYPSQLSGGERQRVGVARALAADPPLMLMDEPFGAVDPIVRDRLQNEFLRLQEELAKTILFVTHDIDEAIKMGDLVAVMEVGGHLAQFGPPDEILAKPASDFVARFVGADRGLKRLSLTRVGDLEPTKAVTARPGDSASEARRRARSDPFPYLLLVDADDRPIGWIAEEEIPLSGQLDEAQAIPMSPLLGRKTTLKDALAMMIEADVQAGVVVDKDGKVLGLVTLDAISEALRGKAPRPAGGATVAAWEEAPSMRDGGDQEGQTSDKEQQTGDQEQAPERVAVGPGKPDG
jgi:osmoprotectant transport system ATP-binding protein